jgi:uncharacterized protein
VEVRLESVLGPAEPGHASIARSPVFESPEEVEAGSPLFLDLVEDARILYDPGSFLARYLARLRARLCELGVRRIWRGNAGVAIRVVRDQWVRYDATRFV